MVSKNMTILGTATIFVAAISAWMILSGNAPFTQNTNPTTEQKIVDVPRQPEQALPPRNISPEQNIPRLEGAQKVQVSRWIDGGGSLSVERSGLTLVQPNLTMTDNFLGRVPKLARAISIYEEEFAFKQSECKRIGGCVGPESPYPTPAMVDIDENDFNIINSTFKLTLVGIQKRPAGAYEIRKTTYCKAGVADCKVVDEKVFVERPPKQGEEAVPARVQMMHGVNVFYKDIGYTIRLYSTWKMP